MTSSLPTHTDVAQADLFGPDVLWMTRPLANDLSCLFPEERAVIEHAVPKRQREFVTGRLCARNRTANECCRMPSKSDQQQRKSGFPICRYCRDQTEHPFGPGAPWDQSPTAEQSPRWRLHATNSMPP